MEKNYSNKNPSNKKEGPSELTVKRILAFSKAYKTLNDSNQEISKELKK
tara:strand:+ start:6381 stop:6527 length:147 start_codon:yes stop_codon:yes gene_type:complete